MCVWSCLCPLSANQPRILWMNVVLCVVRFKKLAGRRSPVVDYFPLAARRGGFYSSDIITFDVLISMQTFGAFWSLCLWWRWCVCDIKSMCVCVCVSWGDLQSTLWEIPIDPSRCRALIGGDERVWGSAKRVKELYYITQCSWCTLLCWNKNIWIISVMQWMRYLV